MSSAYQRKLQAAEGVAPIATTPTATAVTAPAPNLLSDMRSIAGSSLLKPRVPQAIEAAPIAESVEPPAPVQQSLSDDVNKQAEERARRRAALGELYTLALADEQKKAAKIIAKEAKK